MNDVLHMLLGAVLVCLGILATAAADRIRQLRISRRDNTRVSPRTPAVVLSGSDEVVTALVSAGYKKALATQAERVAALPASSAGMSQKPLRHDS